MSICQIKLLISSAHTQKHTQTHTRVHILQFTLANPLAADHYVKKPLGKKTKQKTTHGHLLQQIFSGSLPIRLMTCAS